MDFADHQVMIYKRTPEDIEAVERAERTLFADPDDANFYAQLKDSYRSTIRNSRKKWTDLFLSKKGADLFFTGRLS